MKRFTGFIFVSALLAGSALADDAMHFTVNQVTDAQANTPSHMFRFEPDLLTIPLGAKIEFDNFDGDHTVLSIKKMTPEGGPGFNFGKLDKNRFVTFDVPGIYGITCGLHGRFGMAMIVKVGDQPADFESVRATVPGGRKGKKLHELLDRLAAK